MTADELVLRFRHGDAGADKIQAAVDAILAQLFDPASRAARDTRAAGIDPADLRDITVNVSEEEQGFEPITTILIAIATGAASAAGKTVWDKVIWPPLQTRLGGGVLGERLEDRDRDRP